MTDGDPAIALGPLKIWISRRQFPGHDDYWDGNWLSVTARCEAPGSQVEASGTFINLGELMEWKERLEQFRRTLDVVVELPAMEPTLRVKIEAKPPLTGQLRGEVSLRTGVLLAESHRYQFELDQSYLPALLVQLAEVFRAYPIRGKP